MSKAQGMAALAATPSAQACFHYPNTPPITKHGMARSSAGNAREKTLPRETRRGAPGSFREGLIDLRLLKIFVAVTAHGNMTLSARGLGLTQGAVSQSIRKLENELKVELFHHGHRPLQLTSAGRVLLHRATLLI